MEGNLNKCFLNKIRYFLILAVLAALLAAPTGAAAEQTVAVVPFTVYAEKDLTFLQKGIVDMLTSRLSQEGEVTVIGRESTAAALEIAGGPLNPETAQSLGKKLGADYVLFGSLTVFGESVSVDAQMLDVAGRRPPLPFFTQSASFGEVIPAIDRFAALINEEVFGRKTVRAAAPAPPAESSAPSQAPSSGSAAPDTRVHPDKLIEGGFGDALEQQRFTESGIALTSPWKSRSFDELINGIDLGDVDGDGRIETVIAITDQVLVYRAQERRFFEAARFELPGSRYALGVDVADINKNGTPEIFVTALNRQRNGLASMVFEYAGGEYKPIVESSPHYFRVVQKRDFGSQLYGQRQKVGEEPFSTPVYRMDWDGQDYTQQELVLRAGLTNVLGFSMGYPTNAQEELAVAYSDRDRLMVLDLSGKEVWQSGNRIGGSTLFLNMAPDDRGMQENRAYLPMRVRVADLNGDGVGEVVAAENQEAARRLLKQFRNFTESQLTIFSWDGIGLAPIWKTRSMSGHIRDFALGDFDGDGTDEIVGVLVDKEGTVVGMDPKCAVIAYDILVRTGGGNAGQQ